MGNFGNGRYPKSDYRKQAFRTRSVSCRMRSLMQHAGQIVTRTMLLENVWSFHFDPRTNIIESHMSRLSSKVDRGFGSELIHTVRGSGYRIDARA